jgi:hypothetical protein
MGFFHRRGRKGLAQHPPPHGAVMGPPPAGRSHLAAQRHQIPGVDRLQCTLQEVEVAQRGLRAAADGLRAALSILPLAKAYAEFQDQGGISASDWHDWLDGKALPGNSHMRQSRR